MARSRTSMASSLPRTRARWSTPARASSRSCAGSGFQLRQEFPMRVTRLLVFVALVSLAAPASAWDEGEKPEENTEFKDHPLVPRFPKSVLVDGEQKEFEE